MLVDRESSVKMFYTVLYLVIVFEATLVNVQNVNGAFYDLSEVMDEEDSILMARASSPVSSSRRSVSRFRDQMAQLQPTDTSKTSRASLFLPGTGMFGSSQPARTILVAPAATSGALTGAACCPCTAATSGAVIAGRLTAATGGFGWPSGFTNPAFTQYPTAFSTFPAVSGQLIAPLYLSSSQNQPQQQLLSAIGAVQQQQQPFTNHHHHHLQQQQQQSHHESPSQQSINYNQGQVRLPYSPEDGQIESLADGKRKTRRLSTRG